MTIFRFSMSALMIFSIGVFAQQESPVIEEVVVTVTKKEAVSYTHLTLPTILRV